MTKRFIDGHDGEEQCKLTLSSDTSPLLGKVSLVWCQKKMKANSKTALNRLSAKAATHFLPSRVTTLPFMFFSELFLSCIAMVDIFLSF